MKNIFKKINLSKKQKIVGGSVAAATLGALLAFGLTTDNSQDHAEPSPSVEPTPVTPKSRPQRVVAPVKTLPRQSHRDYTHYVVSNGLNVRFGPSIDFRLATTTPLEKGTCIKVNFIKDGWASALLNTRDGQRSFWVAGGSQYIRPIRQGQRCE